LWWSELGSRSQLLVCGAPLSLQPFRYCSNWLKRKPCNWRLQPLSLLLWWVHEEDRAFYIKRNLEMISSQFLLRLSPRKKEEERVKYSPARFCKRRKLKKKNWVCSLFSYTTHYSLQYSNYYAASCHLIF